MCEPIQSGSGVASLNVNPGALAATGALATPLDLALRTDVLEVPVQHNPKIHTRRDRSPIALCVMLLTQVLYEHSEPRRLQHPVDLLIVNMLWRTRQFPVAFTRPHDVPHLDDPTSSLILSDSCSNNQRIIAKIQRGLFNRTKTRFAKVHPQFEMSSWNPVTTKHRTTQGTAKEYNTHAWCIQCSRVV
jgi:hypothetical protein